jgi:hypothetical protein
MGLIEHDRGTYKNALEDFAKALKIQ